MNDIERLSAALIDRYRIDRQIGAGGMASVYLAHDLRHQRAVAIKVLRQDIGTAVGAERFLREIRIAANLAHPHILPLHDSGNVQEVLYYVMPFVQGESLRERLTREQQLPFDEALQLTHEVADALAYAHRRGVVHRDVKPENILLSDGHAFVADFGIARALSAQGERLTNSGLAIGTPAYMSPEQASGAIEPDARTDVYSLGCVLYEMLGGVPPFTGPNPQTVLARKMLDPVPSLRTLRDSVPLHVERAIARALAKSPADRFTSTTEFAEALREKTDEGVARGDSQWGRFLTFGVPSLAILGTALVLSTTDWHPSASAKGSLSHRQITFTGQARWPTISPDGQFIAYVEGELGTRGRLLVQDLAGGDPVTVLDSVRVGIAPRWGHAEHGILVPAWSLGERGRGGLYAVPRLGGQPRKLADGRISGFGYDADGETLLTIVQNRDGKVLIVRTRPGSVLGDTLASSAATGFWYAEGSPNGRWFAGVLRLPKRDEVIGLLSSDGTKHVVVDSGPLGYWTRWSDDGRALYYKRGSSTADLVKVSIDPSTGIAQAAPEVLLSGVPIGRFDLSSTKNRIAYERPTLRMGLRVLRIGSGALPRDAVSREITRTTAFQYLPAISPDGRRVAFVQGARERSDIHLRSLDGTQSQRLTHLEDVIGDIAWSPHGDWLVFTTRANGGSVMMLNLADGATRSIGRGVDPTYFYAWPKLASTLDGQKVLYWAADSLGATTILRATEILTGRTRDLLSGWQAGGRALLLSPDGTRVITPGNSDTLWSISLSDGAATPHVTELRGTPLILSNDGFIYYHSVPPRDRLGDDALPTGEIRRVRIGATRSELYVRLPVECRRISATTDMRILVCGVIHEETDIWIADNFERRRGSD